MMRRATAFVFVVSLFIAIGLLFPASAAAQNNVTTAQGIMVKVSPANGHTYALIRQDLYEFDSTEAQTYFTNTWNGVAPTFICSGNCGGANGTPSATPAAPAPDASKTAAAASDNKCVFLNGGTLNGATYTQTAQNTAGSGGNFRTFTFTYTYNVSPTQETVNEGTAWDFVETVDDDGNTTDVTLGATIAGQSVVVSNKAKGNGWSGPKYSFDLGMTDFPRIENLNVAVLKEGDSDPFYDAPAAVTIDFPVDFDYETNAGSYGRATASLSDGDARSILNGDTFPGNNDGGWDGSSLALATMEDILLEDLEVGVYYVTISGTVKGNAIDMPDSSFSITYTVEIIGDGCNED